MEFSSSNGKYIACHLGNLALELFVTAPIVAEYLIGKNLVDRTFRDFANYLDVRESFILQKIGRILHYENQEILNLKSPPLGKVYPLKILF